MATINSISNKNQNFLESVKVFPISVPDNPLLQKTINNIGPVMSNISLANDILKFDLDLEGTDFEAYDKLKVTCLDRNGLSLLRQLEFPKELSTTAIELLFRDGAGEKSLMPKKIIEGITVDLSGKVYSDQIRVFVTYTFNEFDSGKVFLFNLGLSQIVVEAVTPIDTQEIKPYSFNKNLLSSLKEDTVASNLLINYSSSGVLSGVFALDAEKLLKRNCAFPNLINAEKKQSLDTFINNVQIILRGYDSTKLGPYLKDTYGPFFATTVNDLRVNNSKGKVFYNFFASKIEKLLEYQAEIRFNTFDPTIEMAKKKLTELIMAKGNNDRSKAEDVILSIYMDDQLKDYSQEISRIKSLSDIKFFDLISMIEKKINKDITAKNKVVVNSASDNSQYMSPSPSAYKFYAPPFIQKIKTRIVLNQESENNFFKLEQSLPLKSLKLTNLDLNNLTVTELKNKSFIKTNNLINIGKFSIVTEKEPEGTRTGLQNDVNCGDENYNISTLSKETKMTLSETNEREIELLYLDRVGDSVSALIFKKADQQLIQEITQERGKVLARLVNNEEFFDSYFYIENDGVS